MDSLTRVKFTNLDKILYPNLALKKSQVIEYYIKVAPLMLDYLKDRPLVTTRFPNGITKDGFYEKDAPKGTPQWVDLYKKYSKSTKRNLNYILCNNLDTLLWLANLASLEIHIPLAKKDSYENPDLILFDIDPEPPANINDAVEIANLLKETLDNMSLKSYPKTSGKKGLHVIVPIKPGPSYAQTRDFVHLIGKYMAKKNPIVVPEFSQSKESGKVHVDYRQNSAGQIMICPYSLRAEKEAPVSTPLSWGQIQKGLKPKEFNIFSVVKQKTNPWKEFWSYNQKLDV
jgi:bifunctional non-homologous end joining protein LigD